MAVIVTLDVDLHVLRRQLTDPNGPLADNLRVRAERVEATARTLAPVDTGRLRSSIHVEGPQLVDGKLACDVVASVNYAGWVHDGTRRMRARPFLVDALPAAG